MARTWKEFVGGLGAGLLSGGGLPRLLHSRLYQNELSILMYHAVVREPLPVADWCFLEESVFRRQIAYVARSFQVVSLREAVAMLAAGGLQRPTLAITFDDGYQNNFEVALPVLAEYGCPATVFLTTRFLNSDELPWFCRLNLALTLTEKKTLEWEDSRFAIRTNAQKSSAGVALHKALKKRHPYSIDPLVDDICRALEVDTRRKFHSGSNYHMLRSSAVVAMLKSGLIEFGAHTHNHSILSRLAPGERQAEILGSLQRVAAITGRSCELFAYPNGARGDYDLSSIELLQSAGVRAAVSTISGPNTGATPAMELRRYGVGSDLNFSVFKAMAHHLSYRMRRLSSPRAAHA